MKAKDLPEVVAFLIVFAVGMLVTVVVWHRPAYIVMLAGSCGVVPTWFTAWFYRARAGTDVC